MDAAAAAAMSDPDRNPNFRRRWGEAETAMNVVSPRSSSAAIGTLGQALLEAMDRRRRADQQEVFATVNAGWPR